MNTVALIGRITKDPEVRYTTGQNQMAVCSFTLAVDRIGKDKPADFIRCTSFGKTAETIGKHIQKGRQMGITGHIQTGEYTDKEGRKVYTTDVIVDRMDFVGNKTENQMGSRPEPVREQMAIPEGFEAIDDEDVPF